MIGIAIYSSEENVLVSLDNFYMEWFRKVPTTKGIIYIPEGSGDFYIKVFATPETSWTLEVELSHS